MKKNELTDKNYAKGSKGFYAALGISAVMIGAACLFAHDQGDRIADKAPKSDKSPVIVNEAPAAKRVTDVPKAAAAPVVTAAATAAPVTVDAPQITIPAAKITADAPFEADSSFTDPASPAAAEAGMKNAAAPLKDMSSILGSFSGSELVKNETTGTWQTHNGTDIAAEVGADVYSVAGGEIASVANDPLWGVSVIIDHKNGYTTKYCGLGSDLAVQQGDSIERGSVIGAVGSSADVESSLPAHLHIEITHNGSYIDPMTVLDQQ